MPKLGLQNGKLNDCPSSPNCVNSLAQDARHSIRAIEFAGNANDAKTQILQLLSEMKRTKIVVDEDHYIHAEFTSMIFRFVDDIEFHFPDTENQSTSIQVRSASRTGYSDLGKNRKRVEMFRNLLK